MEEAALLESARRRLEADPRGDTRSHAARFPDAQLAAERELIAIDALRRLGRTQAAQRRARALLRRAPRGMYAERERGILDALSSPQSIAPGLGATLRAMHQTGGKPCS